MDAFPPAAPPASDEQLIDNENEELENSDEEESEGQSREEGILKLSIGFMAGATEVMQVRVADTGSEAEKIYTKKPKQGQVNTWMGQVIAVSVSEIAGQPIASEFLKQTDKKIIPELVKKIPFLDVGSMLIQIQRECWEDVIPDQRIKCTNCGTNLKVDVELDKIITPKNPEGKPITEYVVKLKKPHIIQTGIDILSDWEGLRFNRLKFRTLTLGDAINHEGVAKDDVQFWRNMAFDTLLDVYYEDEESGEIITLPPGFLVRRAKALWLKDFDTKKLKEIRTGMQTTLPSTKAYYEETCPECDEQTPFFANVSYFFQA